MGYSPPHARVVCATCVGLVSPRHCVVSHDVLLSSILQWGCWCGGVWIKARSQQPGFSAKKKMEKKVCRVGGWLLVVVFSRLSLPLVSPLSTCCVAECAYHHHHPYHQGLSIPGECTQQHPAHQLSPHVSCSALMSAYICSYWIIAWMSGSRRRQ